MAGISERLEEVDAALAQDRARNDLGLDDIERYLRVVQAILVDDAADEDGKSAARDRLRLLLERLEDKQIGEEDL